MKLFTCVFSRGPCGNTKGNLLIDRETMELEDRAKSLLREVSKLPHNFLVTHRWQSQEGAQAMFSLSFAGTF